MAENSTATGMKDAWNRRAGKDPFHYVETQHWDGDVAKFFALGEERAKIVLDPVLKSLGIDASLKAALDLGCGVGRFSRALSLRFAHVFGIDVSEEMIRRATELELERGGAIEFLAGDGFSLPVADRSVDFVFSYEVFQHFPSPQVTENNFREIARVLRADGYALVHCKVRDDKSSFLRSVYHRLPGQLVVQLASLRGRDPLKTDSSYRGTVLGFEQLRAMCADTGLDIVDFLGDPTHGEGTRTFVLARPTTP